MKINLPFLLASLSLALTACGGGSSVDEGGGTTVLGTSSAVSAGETTDKQTADKQQLSHSTAVTSPTPAPTTSSTTQLDSRLTCNLPNFQQEILSRVNQARAAGRTCGSTSYAPAPALRWNGMLFNAAGGHSTDMAANNYFSHTSQDGRNPGQRITGAGYAWRGYGENIAAGQTSVQAVVNGWLSSPGHCANLMKASHVDIATACVASSTSTYRTYWTMELARPY